MKLRRIFLDGEGSPRAGWRILLFVLSSAAATIVIQYVVAAAVPQPLMTESTQALVLALGTLAGHFLMLRWVERRPWSFVGLGRPAARPSQLGRGIAIGALAIGAPSLALMSIRWLQPQAVVAEQVGWLDFMLGVTWLLVWAALWEELVVRGYIFAVLREALGPAFSLGVTSVIFGLLHLQNPEVGIRSVVTVVLAGVFLGTVLIVTGSLYAAWMAHLAWNWVLVALLHSPVSGLELPAPDYRVVDSGPDWATGGAWGPEGGAFAALGMMGGTVYLFGRRKRQQPRGSAGGTPSGARTSEPEDR